MPKHMEPPKRQRKFRTPWAELHYVCRRMHYWLYQRGAAASARRYLSRLGRILRQLPDEDMAILRQEGLALFHELKGDTHTAIKHRRREIQLIEKLHADANAHGYDADLRAWILAGRDVADLQERRHILSALTKSVQRALRKGPRGAERLRDTRARDEGQSHYTAYGARASRKAAPRSCATVMDRRCPEGE